MGPSESTYDPATDVGKVRLEIDDTDVEGTPAFVDAEVEYFLEEEGGILAAAARGCEVLARRYAKAYDITTDDQSLKRSQRAAAFAKAAETLRERAEKEEGLGTIATVKTDGYNQTGVDNETIDGTGPGGRVRAGYENPDRVP